MNANVGDRNTAALLRQLREIVTNEMVGIVSWDADVLIFALERLEPKPRERQKLREMVVIGFPKTDQVGCRFQMGASSSEEKPPLGKLVLRDRDHVAVEGPLNKTTSNQIGAYIRNSFIDRDSTHERSER